jgi:hypothetical protein
MYSVVWPRSLTVACLSSRAAVRLAAAGSLLDAPRAALRSAVRAAAAVTLTHALLTGTWAAVRGGAVGGDAQAAQQQYSNHRMKSIAGETMQQGVTADAKHCLVTRSCRCSATAAALMITSHLIARVHMRATESQFDGQLAAVKAAHHDYPR